ncbi:MAG: FMN-binding protein [Gammaproteobacteria bacterium]|nr:FMN-binding protein [Gammaproteobacteria bacterium]
MSDTQYVQLEPQGGRAWHMYRAMVGIGLICAVIIVSVFQLTLPVINQNKLELLESSLYRIFPDARQFVRYEYVEAGKFIHASEEGKADVIYAMYDSYNKLAGLVLRAKAMGYQDLIEMLYGYQPQRQIISGYQVIDSRETPGLGSRIETDAVFQKNFHSLDVTLNASGDALQNPIEIVKPGAKTQAWQIDTLTGATISSRTVATMVAASAAQWIPRIHQRLQDFEQ